ncbi:MAG: DUF1684 domain-containing protein [Algoriphagus sp.]|nr:DUF1684 domain-containing protein [Algoriphagus sp.]
MKSFLVCFFILAFVGISRAQESEFTQWKFKRQAELTGEDGWLNLVGLYWMEVDSPFLEEVNGTTLGFAAKFGSATLGKFDFGKDSVWFEPTEVALQKKSNVAPSKRMLVYPIAYGTGGGVYYKNWKWTIIQRGGNYALRLRDLNHPKLQNFTPTPTFNYNPAFRFTAKLIPKFNQTLEIPNVLGQLISWKVTGVLQFEHEGQKYELLVLDELGKLFVLFSDETSALETYPTGRYLYVHAPDVKGMTILDFNYAYNPPCAYTEFATCPIPPKSNRLPFAVPAGEKMPEGHE